MNGSFVITAGHPCLAGHFPGRPLAPGVLLLDGVAALLGLLPAAFGSVRFTRPVLPGDRVEVSAADGRFVGRVGSEVVLQGTIAAR